MFLAFDIGNSTIAAAIFQNETLIARMSVLSTVQRSADETWNVVTSFLTETNIPSENINGVGISSVVPFHTSLFTQLFRENLNCEPLVISGLLDLGMKIHYDNPDQLGPDRICSAVAGFHKFGGPLIIIDFGTATTYGVIAESGDFLGGTISLGVKSLAETLHMRTAQLPQIELQLPDKAICTNTISAMQAGTMFAAVDSVEGMIRRIRTELGVQPKVVATGGLSTLMSKQIPMIDDCEPTLVLEGIRLVHERLEKRNHK
jgi:type III pantothenate kinase